MKISTALCIYIGSAVILSTGLYLSEAKLKNSGTAGVSTQTAKSPEQKKRPGRHFDLNVASIKQSAGDAVGQK